LAILPRLACLSHSSEYILFDAKIDDPNPAAN
jgi:hypothetical protein